MSTRDGEEAVQALVDAVVADAGLEVDFTVIARRLNDGVELIGSYHPEVYSPIVVRKIEDRVSQGIAERLINSGRR